MADLIKIAEEAFATGKQHPSFKAGDTVTVAYKIVEGNKERVQLYRGVVIKIAGHGEKEAFHCTQDVWYYRCRTYLPPRVSRYREHRSEQGGVRLRRAKALLPPCPHW